MIDIEEETESAPMIIVAASTEKIFDFTQPLELLDEEARSVYYRLRRVALTAADGEYKANNGRGDVSLLPDGKVYTEAEVVDVLGLDYKTGLVINKKCCN